MQGAVRFFNIHITTNLPRSFPVTIFLNCSDLTELRSWVCGPTFFGAPRIFGAGLSHLLAHADGGLVDNCERLPSHGADRKWLPENPVSPFVAEATASSCGGRGAEEDVARCLHFTAGCTTGWVNYVNERSQAALERSSQDAYDVIRLTCAARRRLCGQ